MNVLIRSAPDNGMRKYQGWEGLAVGISGQFVAVRLTHDPMGNPCAKGAPHFFTPLELESPIDWERTT